MADNTNSLPGPAGSSEPRRPSTVPVPKVRRGLRAFLREVRRELTKVTWPTVPETNRLTGVVLAVVALLAVALGTLSLFFEALLNLTGRP
ncbi:MAG: preprotein translocase subunit SecE, partial [Armatimonadota bacterium]